MKTRVKNNGTEPEVRMVKAVALNQLCRKTKRKKIMLYAQALLCLMPLACQSQPDKLDVLGYEGQKAQFNDLPVMSKGTVKDVPIIHEDTSSSWTKKSHNAIKDKKTMHKLLPQKSTKHQRTKSDGHKPYHPHKNDYYQKRRHYYDYPYKHYHYNPNRHYDDHAHKRYHSSRSREYSSRSRRR